jgi:hypothetical protein
MSETPAPKRKRRVPLRALTLAEVVGIAAVIIAALGYWDTHRERQQTEADKAAAERQHQAEAKAGALKTTFLMSGQPQGTDLIRLTPVHPDQVIQTQAISFPAEVRGEPVQTTGNPRIEAGWLEGGLEAALKARGVKAGRGRVPVGVATSYIEDGQEKTDHAVYLVAYTLHPRMLRSARVELEGLSLLRRDVGEDLQKAVDTAWNRIAPPPAPK